MVDEDIDSIAGGGIACVPYTLLHIAHVAVARPFNNLTIRFNGKLEERAGGVSESTEHVSLGAFYGRRKENHDRNQAGGGGDAIVCRRRRDSGDGVVPNS